MTKTVRVAVIGSGLAGLTAAYRLSKTPKLEDVEFEVHLFDKVINLRLFSSSISLIAFFLSGLLIRRVPWAWTRIPFQWTYLVTKRNIVLTYPCGLSKEVRTLQVFFNEWTENVSVVPGCHMPGP